jgi:hypothetical protein
MRGNLDSRSSISSLDSSLDSPVTDEALQFGREVAMACILEDDSSKRTVEVRSRPFSMFHHRADLMEGNDVLGTCETSSHGFLNMSLILAPLIASKAASSAHTEISRLRQESESTGEKSIGFGEGVMKYLQTSMSKFVTGGTITSLKNAAINVSNNKKALALGTAAAFATGFFNNTYKMTRDDGTEVLNARWVSSLNAYRLEYSNKDPSADDIPYYATMIGVTGDSRGDGARWELRLHVKEALPSKGDTRQSVGSFDELQTPVDASLDMAIFDGGDSLEDEGADMSFPTKFETGTEFETVNGSVKGSFDNVKRIGIVIAGRRFTPRLDTKGEKITFHFSGDTPLPRDLICFAGYVASSANNISLEALIYMAILFTSIKAAIVLLEVIAPENSKLSLHQKIAEGFKKATGFKSKDSTELSGQVGAVSETAGE